ncbi:MAG TPA: hypothetical protein VNW97_10140 [Candidatus Saccharimonadales bacterium]|jgi:hypothetical protein|nr:hypothetical protein [Candidatus Saccharimonadales bacterium]
MKKFVMILFAAISVSAFAADTTVKGHLVDLACASEEGNRPGFGAKHTKGCLQMPDCVKSGYGVLTDDHKVIKLDAAGNEKAIQFIGSLQKKNDIAVSVTGNVDGDKITVSKIELQ